MPIAFKSMELDDEAKADMAIPCSPCATSETPKKLLPEYPWGLRITLGDAELKKLGIDISDLPVGAMIHLHALSRVTSVSQDQRQDGSTPCRAEFQIEQLACESEDKENAEAERATPRRRLRSTYDK